MFRCVRSLGADLPDDFALEVAVIMSAGLDDLFLWQLASGLSSLPHELLNRAS